MNTYLFCEFFLNKFYYFLQKLTNDKHRHSSDEHRTVFTDENAQNSPINGFN